MRHMVVYRSAGGGASYQETEDLESAVRMVEHLRNTENIVDTRIYGLHEVPIEFKAYFRVEVLPATAPAPPPEPALIQEPTPVEEPAFVEEGGVEEIEPAPVLATVAASALDPGLAPEDEYTPPQPPPPGQASGRFGLFSRG